MNLFFNILMTFLMILCVIFIILILVQNPKGSGLSINFINKETTMFGIQNTNKFMDKAIWILITTIAIIVIFSSIIIANPDTIYHKNFDNTISNMEKNSN